MFYSLIKTINSSICWVTAIKIVIKPVVDKTPALAEVLYSGKLLQLLGKMLSFLGSICNIGRAYRG